MGGISTIWTGNALDCLQLPNEIVLLHLRFLYSVIGGSCNNGAIVARSLSVEDKNFTSQLNVTVTPDTAGKTIDCFRDDGIHEILLFSSIIPTITGLSLAYIQQINFMPFIEIFISPILITIGPLWPPNTLEISNADFSLREFTFSWSPVVPDSPAIHYNILASNCGSCPTTTNHTSITCTDIPTNDSICTFAVQTVVCGNITGNTSDPVSITLYTTVSTDSSNPIEKQATHNLSTTETMGMNNSATSRVYIISFSCLATALFVGAVASLTVIAIFLKRSKAKTRAVSVQSNRAEGTTRNEPGYENVMPSPSPSISTQDNVAYGHERTSTRRTGSTLDVQNDIGRLPPASSINTHNNVAYGHTKINSRSYGGCTVV
jgi:hypothetical protein